MLRRSAAHRSQATCREKALSPRERARPRRNSHGGDVPGPRARPPTVLPLAGRSHQRLRTRRGLPRQRTVRRPPPRSQVRLPLSGRRNPRCRSADGRTHRLANLPAQIAVSVFTKSKRCKNGKGRPPVHDDLVERDFTVDEPNQLWRPTSPNTAPMKASFICARSRTCSLTASLGIRSTPDEVPVGHRSPQ